MDILHGAAPGQSQEPGVQYGSPTLGGVTHTCLSQCLLPPRVYTGKNWSWELNPGTRRWDRGVCTARGHTSADPGKVACLELHTHTHTVFVGSCRAL